MSDAQSPLDVPALEAALETEHGLVVDEVDVLADGLNLNAEVSTAAGETYVLRRPRMLRETQYMNDLRGEYEVLERLRETPVPAPEPILFHDDCAVLGDRFFLMSALEGATIPLGSVLPERFQAPRSRARLGRELIDTLAEVHAVDPEPFAETCPRYTPRDQVDLGLDRLDEIERVVDGSFPTLRSVGERLRDRVPEPASTTLVHGDFRPSNVTFTGADRPALAGVLDWESAAIGDPLTDLAYLLLRWRDEGDSTPSLDPLDARYSEDAIEELRAHNERGMAPFTARPGSPSRRDLIDRYETETGRPVEHEGRYRAHAAFLLGLVWADLHRDRVEAGEDPDREPYVEYMGLIAEHALDGDR